MQRVDRADLKNALSSNLLRSQRSLGSPYAGRELSDTFYFQYRTTAVCNRVTEK